MKKTFGDPITHKKFGQKFNECWRGCVHYYYCYGVSFPFLVFFCLSKSSPYFGKPEKTRDTKKSKKREKPILGAFFTYARADAHTSRMRSRVSRRENNSCKRLLYSIYSLAAPRKSNRNAFLFRAVPSARCSALAKTARREFHRFFLSSFLVIVSFIDRYKSGEWETAKMCRYSSYLDGAADENINFGALFAIFRNRERTREARTPHALIRKSRTRAARDSRPRTTGDFWRESTAIRSFDFLANETSRNRNRLSE